MKYNISFFESPDWRRESSSSPAFRIGFFLVILIMSVIAATGRWKAEIEHRRGELVLLEIRLGQDRGRIREIERKIKCTAAWQKILGELGVRERRRVVWCRQLAALQSLVPAEVELRDLAMSSTELLDVQADKTAATAGGPRDSAPPRTRTAYALRIVGVAYGGNAEDVITKFSQDLPRNSEMQPFLESVELTSVRPDSRTGDGESQGKEFVILCQYKPISWSLDHVD